MIICSCQIITSDDIERAVAWMRAADPQVMVTPGKVYRALGKKAVCGGCASLFVAAVHSVPDDGEFADVPAELRILRTASDRRTARETRRERRRCGTDDPRDGGRPAATAIPD